MIRIARLAPLFCALFLVAPTAGHAKKPADKFKGQIILSDKPFPASFRSDARFISHMKKVNTKSFRLGEEGKVDVEFMAFFSRPYKVTEFTAKVYEITDGVRPQVIYSFPINPNPGQGGQRILASYTTLRRDTFDDERDRKYRMVISVGYQGSPIAKTDFVIKARPMEKAAAGPSVVEFK